MSLLSRAGIAVVAVTAVTAVAACGSGSNKANPSGVPSVALPTGTPITIMQTGPVAGAAAVGNTAVEMLPAAQAAVDSINAAGGIKDIAGGANHPLVLIKCTIELVDTGPQSQACARQAIDGKIAAISGKYTGADADIKNIEAAGIPVVAAYPNESTSDATAPLSFPITEGPTVLSVGLGLALQAAGAQKISAALADSPGARNIPPLIQKTLKNGAADYLGTVAVPLDPSADLSTYAAQIVAQKPDGVIVIVSPAGNVQMIKALKQAGYKGKIMLAGFTLLKSSITSLGADAEGLLLGSVYSAASSKVDPTIAKFNASMDKYAPKADRTELAVGAWVSVNVIAQALAVAKTQDAAGLAVALQGFKVTNGAAPSFTLGVSGLKLFPFPRIPRSTVQIQTVKGGVVAPLVDGQFLDLDNPSVPVTLS